MEKMHADELEIDEPLVRRLLDRQFPEWDSLPLRRIEPSGTDHAIFRLGDELSVRLPRVDGPTEPGGKEFMWLPTLAPLLPVDVPVPIAQGWPGHGYPWFWEIHTWVRGETVPVETIDATQVARDLCVLIAALQRSTAQGLRPGAALHWPNATTRFAIGWRGLTVTRGSRPDGNVRLPRRHGRGRPSGITGTLTPGTG